MPYNAKRALVVGNYDRPNLFGRPNAKRSDNKIFCETFYKTHQDSRKLHFERVGNKL